MTSLFQQYQQLKISLPETNQTWNMYGAGVENIGRQGTSEALSIPEPGPDQLLVRIDAVGLCFSDVKLITQGNKHPKLYNRDLETEPTRLGHEACLTLIKVGADLQDNYQSGERYAVQPDIYQNGKSTAYGYTVPGGLVQYHLIGSEVLETDAGACLLQVSDSMGFAEAALLEPWGCVWASYTQRRRLEPKHDGTLWIIGQPGDTTEYQFSSGLDAASTIILTNAPESVTTLANQTDAKVIIRDNIESNTYDDFSQELTQGAGFDDIVMLAPKSAEQVTRTAKNIARRGTLNLVGTQPIDGLVEADVGRLHYDYIAFIGTSETDIAAAYGESRNRCDLVSGGAAVFVGAGGPMGQMHVQRAIEKSDGPALVIVTDINDQRLAEIESRFKPLTVKNNCRLITFNPQTSDASLYDFVMSNTSQKGADDVVVCVPNGNIMADAATFMNDNAMLVLFAGVPNGTLAPVDISKVYLHNAQFTGTSGLTIEDQKQVMNNALEGNIAPAVCVAAIGGMQVAKDGIEAMMKAQYPGKIIIFPQLNDLPLLSLDELKQKLPEVASCLAEGNIWTKDAEQALFDHYLQA